MSIEQFAHGVFYLGDARELIRELPSGSINVCLLDPPYGLGFGPLDEETAFYDLEEELYRVAASNAWLVFFWSIKKLPNPLLRLKRFSYAWQLVVLHFSSFTKSVVGDRRYLLVLVFQKGKPKMARRGPDVLLSFELPQVIGRIHNPLFKPTGAILQLLAMFAKAEDTVLDPFAGLGGVPFICELTGKRWVAFERQEEWFRLACEFIREGKIEPERASLDQRLTALQFRMW